MHFLGGYWSYYAQHRWAEMMLSNVLSQKPSLEAILTHFGANLGIMPQWAAIPPTIDRTAAQDMSLR
jgi:predicted TIM-barrel fold metal-dependent hydrolase